ncbi:MAG: hypothetical protein KAS66_07130 [Candidatus Omnitrophica bacterium]|nr:hypothetical protein [Candidatus Omnitrophota bacterium]
MIDKLKVNPYALISLILGTAGFFLGLVSVGLLGVAAGYRFRVLNKQAEGKLRGEIAVIIGITLGVLPFLTVIGRHVLQCFS